MFRLGLAKQKFVGCWWWLGLVEEKKKKKKQMEPLLPVPYRTEN